MWPGTSSLELLGKTLAMSGHRGVRHPSVIEQTRRLPVGIGEEYQVELKALCGHPYRGAMPMF